MEGVSFISVVCDGSNLAVSAWEMRATTCKVTCHVTSQTTYFFQKNQTPISYLSRARPQAQPHFFKKYILYLKMPPKAPPPMRGKNYSPSSNNPQGPGRGKRIRFTNIDPHGTIESQTCVLNSGAQPCSYILDSGYQCLLVTATCLLNMDFYRCGSFCFDKIERALERGNILPDSATGKQSFCYHHVKKLTGLALRVDPVKGMGLLTTEIIPADSIVATFAMNPATCPHLSKTNWNSPDPMIPGMIRENSNHYGLSLRTDDDGIQIDEFGTLSAQAGAALLRIVGGRATTLYFDDACERDLGDYANDYRNIINPTQRNARGCPIGAGDLPDAYQWRGIFYPNAPAAKAKAKAEAAVRAATLAVRAAKGGAAQMRALSTANYDAGFPARYAKNNFTLPPVHRVKAVPLTANERNSRASSPRSSRNPWCYYEANNPRFQVMRLVYNVYPVEKRDGNLNIRSNNPGGVPNPLGRHLGNIPYELFPGRTGVRYRDVLVLVATEIIAANTFIEWDYGNIYWSSYFCPIAGDNDQKCVSLKTVQNR